MKIESIKIKKKVKEKIETRHSITLAEIEKILLKNNPKFRKVKNCYMAIGIWNRYLTVFFNYNSKNKEVNIITAYPSSRWQIKIYRRLK